MEDAPESPVMKIKVNELLAFERDLKEEKEILQKILVKIDDQIHALQVEQLHLLGLMNKSLKNKKVESPEPKIDDRQENFTDMNLDLSVVKALKYFEEEEDEEDDD